MPYVATPTSADHGLPGGSDRRRRAPRRGFPARSEIVVTARRLDAARSAIEPSLGASSYSLPRAFIENLPGGANTQLNQVACSRA